MIFWAFEQSLISGLVWPGLLGPAMFLALIVTIRVLLEFVLTVFRIAFFLESLGGQVESIAGQAEDIHEDLPRIRFWNKPRMNGRPPRALSRRLAGVRCRRRRRETPRR